MSSVRDDEPQLLLAETVTATCQRHIELLDDATSFGLVQSPAAIPAVFEEEDLNDSLLHHALQPQRDDSIKK